MIDRINIRAIFNNSDIRKLASNLGYLTMLQVANYIFPFISMPYLARVLGVEKFGILAIGTAVVAYFQSITDYGFSYTTVRKIARNRDDAEYVSKITSLTFTAKFVLMIGCAMILVLLCAFVPYLRGYTVVLFATFLYIPGHIFFADWFFQAVEDMKYITILAVISKFVFTVLVFVFIKQESDYILQPILIALGYAVSSFVCIYIMRKKYKVRFVCPSFRSIAQELKEGFDMFVTLFLPTIYTNLNTIILGSSQGDRATGIYNGASRFTGLAYNIFTTISRTVYPFFARKMDKHKLYVYVSLSIAVIISLFLFALAEPLVLILLGEDFSPTIPVLRIVAFTPIAMSITNSYGVNYLVLRGKENIMRNIVIAITVVGCAMGIAGAYLYSYIGVAVASLVTQFIRALLVYLSARQIQKEETALS